MQAEAGSGRSAPPRLVRPAARARRPRSQGPKGNANVGGAEVSGGSVSNADRVVAGMRAGFRACYNRGLASNPELQGSVRIVAKIGPNGEVLSATPQGGGGLGDEVVSCVVRRVQSAHFAPRRRRRHGGHPGHVALQK